MYDRGNLKQIRNSHGNPKIEDNMIDIIGRCGISEVEAKDGKNGN
jgi:hypothetical protein